MTSREQNKTKVLREDKYAETSASLGQLELTFTKPELAMATLLSICVYIIFWILGVSLGLLVPSPLLGILAGTIGFLARKKIKSTKLRILGTDIFWCLLVAIVAKFAFQTVSFILLPISILIGGVVTGIIRRKNFQKYMKKKIIKYGFLLLLILSIPASAFLGLYLYVYRVEIPFDYLHPTTLSEGWVLLEEKSGINNREVSYQKGHSSFSVRICYYPESPSTKEEMGKILDTTIKTMFYVMESESESDTEVNLTREETLEIDGLKKHIFQYDFTRKGKSLPSGTAIYCIWYCDNLERHIRVSAIIRDKPIDIYINQIEEMIRSLDCP